MRAASTDPQPLPMGRKPDRPLFAIGDVHGHLDALDALLEHIAGVVAERHADQAVDLVILGDLVDRGPQPVECLLRAARGIEADHARAATHILMGNHDWYLAAAAGLRGLAMEPRDQEGWLTWGGMETIEALGLARNELEPEAVRDALGPQACAVLENMATSHVSGAICCVHAGVAPGASLAEQDAFDLMWIRRAFLEPAEDPEAAWPFGMTVVHGHTPNAWGVYPHRIGVDTGGYATGHFAAAELTRETVRLHMVMRDD